MNERNTLSEEFPEAALQLQGRSRWSSRLGHGRTGFGPYQTIYIGLQIVINLSDYIAAYASNLLVHCLKFYFTLSYDKYQFFRLWNPFI